MTLELALELALGTRPITGGGVALSSLVLHSPRGLLDHDCDDVTSMPSRVPAERGFDRLRRRFCQRAGGGFRGDDFWDNEGRHAHDASPDPVRIRFTDWPLALKSILGFWLFYALTVVARALLGSDPWTAA